MILQFVIQLCVSEDHIPGINFCVTVNDKMHAWPQTVHLCRHIIMLIKSLFSFLSRAPRSSRSRPKLVFEIQAGSKPSATKAVVSMCKALRNRSIWVTTARTIHDTNCQTNPQRAWYLLFTFSLAFLHGSNQRTILSWRNGIGARAKEHRETGLEGGGGMGNWFHECTSLTYFLFQSLKRKNIYIIHFSTF